MIHRKIILAVLWILSLIAISCYGGAVSYGFFFGITLIPVISALYLWYVYWKFLIYQEVLNKHVVCGQAVPYYFVLQNDDFIAYTSIRMRLFSDFSYVTELPDHTEYELLPGDKFRYDTKLTCKYRGEYHVGVKEIVITDFFKLFRLKYEIPAPIKATVSPRIVPVKTLKSIPEITSFLQKEFVADKTEPDASVKDYVSGDSLKKIHWKATAREQKLKTRQFIGEEKQGITILCDTKRCSLEMKTYLPIENKILEVLLALSFFFAGSNTKLTVLYRSSGLQCKTIEGIRHFEHFYQEVSKVCFDKEYSLEPVLQNAADRNLFLNSKAVFLILHDLTDGIMEWIRSVSSRGLILVVYVITDKDISFYIKQSSLRLKIITIPPEGELEELL